MIDLTRRVPIASHVLRHAVDLVVATQPGAPRQPAERSPRYVRFGASPRGAQALVLAGKVRALLDGRPSVAVDDVRAVAPAALRHRLVVGYEAVADGVTADDLVADLLDAVPGPERRRARRRTEAADGGRRRAAAGVAAGPARAAAAAHAAPPRRPLRRRAPLAALRRVASTSPTTASTTPATTTGASTTRCTPAPATCSSACSRPRTTSPLRIVLDRSASMGFHGKLDQARRLAAAIGFVALLRRDTVTLHTEPADARRRAASPGATPPAACSRDLAALDAAGPTDLARAAGDVLARPGPVGVTVVISDLLNDGLGPRPSTASSPAAATRPCSTSSPTRSCTPTCAATSRWSTSRPASRCR